jgi:hypothetical protein
VDYTIEATDNCGNLSELTFTIELVDLTPPQIQGVPEDMTVSCMDEVMLPATGDCDRPQEIFVIDECECAELTVEVDSIPGACASTYTMMYVYMAEDNCGNMGYDTLMVHVEDTEGPEMVTMLPELEGLESGAVIEVECTGAGFPEWVNDLDIAAMESLQSCQQGNSQMLGFEMTGSELQDCSVTGYMESNTYTWTAADECGNTSEFVLTIQLVDNTPPEILLETEAICEGSDIITPAMSDNCLAAVITYEEFEGWNECLEDTITHIVWTALDYCGNSSTDTQYVVSPPQSLAGLKQDLAALSNDTLNFGCDEYNAADFDPNVINSDNENQCFDFGLAFDLNIVQGEQVENCVNGVTQFDVWNYELTDICGNQEELNLVIGVMDETAPIFENFNFVDTILCGEPLPEYTAIDLGSCNNGIDIQTQTIELNTAYCEWRILERSFLLTDECGNENAYTQTILISNETGPEFIGIPESGVVCGEAPEVIAIDNCIAEEMEVTFVEDTIPSGCEGGFSIRRIYSATSDCGFTSTDTLTIIPGDNTAPNYTIIHPDILDAGHMGIIEAGCSSSSIDDLGIELNSIVFDDGCSPVVDVTLDISNSFGACDLDGFRERRTYVWTATDACGNSTSFTVFVDAVDYQAPEFISFPEDVDLVCLDLSQVEEPIAIDNCSGPINISYRDQEETEGMITTIVRTWTATDICGNAISQDQVITIVQDEDFDCSILVPEVVYCNENDIVIESDVNGGEGPFNYEWEVIGGICTITSGQGTPSITVNIGYTVAEIKLTVTDSRGCVTICYYTLECVWAKGMDFRQLAGNYHLYQNTPNPFTDETFITFNLPEKDEAVIKFYDVSGQLVNEIRGDYEAGINSVLVKRSAFPAAGMYYYELSSGEFTASKKMVVVD